MSYDLMVFDKKRTPANKKEFMSWYDHFTQWAENVDYSEADHASDSLKKWFMEMIKTFPPMNGSLAPSDEEFDDNPDLESRLTDYSIGTEGIYMAFAWSKAEQAYETASRLAKKHDVCFFDVSGAKGDIIMPDGKVIS